MTGQRDALLDDLDRGIIRILQRAGRTPNSEIARSLDVSEATIRNRITRLTGEGLINIVAVPTPRAVGLTMSAIIGISIDLRQLTDLVEQIALFPETRYVGVATGRYDIMIEAFFTDQQHLYEFVAEKLGQLGGVTNAETSVILKVAKFSYEWEIPNI